MAQEVIDLVSSSPPPELEVYSKGPAIETRSAHVGLHQIRTATSTVHKPFDNGFDFLSEDEFDTTGDLDASIAFEARGSKRRRISASPDGVSSASKGARSGLGIDNGPSGQDVVATTARTAASPDPFELTSSLDVSPSMLDAIDRRKSSHAPPPPIASRIYQLPTINSDPFASSPQPHLPPQAEAPPSAQVVVNSDPFASSPKPGQSAPHTSQAVPKPRNATLPASALLSSPPRHPVSKHRRDVEAISSSAPERQSFGNPSVPRSPSLRGHTADVIDIEDSDSADGSDSDLPDIRDFDLSRPRRRPRSPLRRSRSEAIPSKTARVKDPSVQKKSAEERQREREAKTAAKEVDKEKKRREREQAKEAKTREKEHAAALAEVNKLRTDKKVSSAEMIVDVPETLSATVGLQARTLLEGLGVQHSSWDSLVENAIKWRRKISSHFDEDKGYWVPAPLRIEVEKQVLIVMHADEVVKRAVDETFGDHVAKVQRHFPGYNILYLIEGLTPWIRKNRNIRNRQFTSGVRGPDESAAAKGGRKRKAPAVQEYISEDLVEDALLELQVAHDVLIHHTTIPLETAQWIAIFTQHISTIPYRKQKEHATVGAGFCMESGQVRTGNDRSDTYVRLLQEIARVTAPIAYGVNAEFDSVVKLVRGLEEGGPSRLEGVRKCINKDGQASDRTIGQAVSKRLYKVFTGRDETSTEV